ncbi:hypothetical protein VTL71DRAFT_6675 [Oculimacula yallundae]|uniref:Heterokaryon incompatibility domain-containing protein n=1 Tax=Oculimacula yallundae TaxID=86028 RepID=A0ABR4BXK8_9HELO
MFCQICQTRIFTNFAAWFDEQPHHETYSGFKRSVEGKCYVCCSLWTELTREARESVSEAYLRESVGDANDPSRIPHQKLGWVQLILIDGQHYPATRFAMKGKSRDSEYILSLSLSSPTSIRRHVHTARLFLRPSLYLQIVQNVELIRMELATDTKSESTFSVAEKWLTECHERHEDCRSPHEGSWYPTRVIDCGTLSIPATSCHLIETNTTLITGHYMTLSHCWGKADCLRLTTNNYAQLLNNIPLSSLPQLYQDAVYAARRLKTRYLWIDALCIIQEGDELMDWQNEVSLMSEVYFNASCNICASHTPDGTNSLFNDRLPEALPPNSVDMTFNSHFNSHFNSQDATHFDIVDCNFWKKEVEDAPINSRAWVFQERLLSGSNLFFGKSQIFWECRKKTATETYPDGLPTLVGKGENLKEIFGHDKGSHSRSDPKPISRLWGKLVSGYTNRSLTFPSDKLAAISSLAKRIQPLIDDEYVVGLWRRTLEYEILWHVRDGSVLFPRPKKYRAPTWSWASVDGRITPKPFDTTAPMYKIVDLKIDHNTNDSYTSVKSGYLILRGFLRTVKISKYDNLAQPGRPNMDSVQRAPSGLYVVGFWFSKPRFYIDTLHDDNEQENAEGTLYFYTMLLLKVVDMAKGIFHRIGICHGTVEIETWENILTSKEEHADYPCEMYQDGKHTIRIE